VLVLGANMATTPPPQGGKPILPQPGQPGPMRPGEFTSGAQPNFVTFGWQNVGPPASVYVQRDDVVFVQVISSLANETITLSWRILEAPVPRGGQPDQANAPSPILQALASNTVQFGQRLISLGAAFTNQTISIVLGEGYLLSFNAIGGTSVDRGRTYIRAWLVRGLLGVTNTFMTLFEDYISGNQSMSWPGGRMLNQTEGTGWVHSLQITTPAAGADWTFTLGGQQRLRIVSLEAQLAVANSGAARPVEVIVDDGANIYARMAANTTFPINATSQLNFSNSGTPSTSISTDIYAQMPGMLLLPPSHRIRSNTTNIVAGDTWSNIWMLVEEWVDHI
jgi:hypothetical protein